MGVVYLGYVWFLNSYPSKFSQPLILRLASVNFLDGTRIEQQRILLAVYPLLCVLLISLKSIRKLTASFRLFYFVLAWMILIQ